MLHSLLYSAILERVKILFVEILYHPICQNFCSSDICVREYTKCKFLREKILTSCYACGQIHPKFQLLCYTVLP